MAVNEEAQAPAPQADTVPEAQDAKIEHTPLEKTPRGETVVIKAKVADPSHLFAPLVFARKTGSSRYEAFTMKDKGKRGFFAFLPRSMLSEGSFEYFIEAQHEEGGATRLGSPRKPFTTMAYDPAPVPVPTTIHTDEPGALVKIDDNEVGRTPITVPLLPGPHAVTVAMADGRGAERQIEIGGRQRKLDLAIDLPRQAGGPATLTVQSEPANANLIVDGYVIGRTPYTGELAAGEHVVAVEMEGRMREERKVFARDGRDTSVAFSLQPLPKGAAVAVESEPTGAVVLLDDKEVGRTPFLASLRAGRHALVLRLEGRREVGTDFNMPKDRDYAIRLKLPPNSAAPSRLTVASAPAGAALTVDGREAGITPWSAELKPGIHKLAVALNGYLGEERVVKVQEARDWDVSFALAREAGPGKLHVQTEPPGASVEVDGKPLGDSPLTADIGSGEHNLQVSLDAYKTVAQAVTLDPGQELSLRLALQQAQPGQVPPLIAVASDPLGVNLYLDGKLVGPTPVKVRSTPGPHEIKLALEGYVTRTGKINLPDTRDFELRMAVSLSPVRGVEAKQAPPSPMELAAAQIKTAHACSKQGDYECALKGYKAAYEYNQDPRLLFNIAQMRRKMGQFKEAEAAYANFLRDAEKSKLNDPNQEKMKQEARIQQAFCQLKLRPEGATAVAASTTTAAGAQTGTSVASRQEEEDNDPPILTHDPVKKAVRGQPVRLLARIVDERSGVGTPQACWRNLYKREFECQPMGKTGEDEYGIEVPAKAVNDGFAYYLEAYDNNDNGPARSGAPELPNSVIVDDPPPVQKPLVVNAIASDAVAQAMPAGYRPAPSDALPTADGNFAEAKTKVDEPKSHLLRYLMMGGAAASVATSAGLFFHARGLANSLNDPNTPDKPGVQNQANTEYQVSLVLVGVTAAFAIGSVAFWNF